MSEPLISARCADFITDLQYEKLPENVRQRAKECLVDFMACTLGGYATAEGDMIAGFAADNREARQATVLGAWQKNSSCNAALANAYNCHILECDDIHKTSIIHGAAPVIAAALAAAELTHSTGRELLQAITAGYEIALRVGEAVMPSHYALWHNTATCGGFGAAAAAGKLLRLDREQLVNALGNAGTQAAGLWEFLEDNAMSKYLHCGKAAANGLLAALLARRGVTGPTKIIEGEKGFVKATSVEINPQEKFATMGRNYKILENGFKPHASCRHTHSTIDAVLQLRETQGIAPEDVGEMVLNVYAAALKKAKNNERFDDPRAARFSLVYCAAAALCRGDVSVGAFSEAMLKDPLLLRTAQKIRVREDAKLTEKYPARWASRVQLLTKDGRALTATVEFPKGDPENPFTREDFEKKFFALTAPAVNRETAARLLLRCWNVEEQEDIARLFAFS